MYFFDKTWCLHIVGRIIMIVIPHIFVGLQMIISYVVTVYRTGEG